MRIEMQTTSELIKTQDRIRFFHLLESIIKRLVHLQLHDFKIRRLNINELEKEVSLCKIRIEVQISSELVAKRQIHLMIINSFIFFKCNSFTERQFFSSVVCKYHNILAVMQIHTKLMRK